MNSSLINKFISTSRFNSYKSLDEYSKNLVFLKNAYIPLSILEVALKNSIDDLLSNTIGIDWIEKDDYNLIFDEIYEILNYFDEEVCIFAKKINYE